MISSDERRRAVAELREASTGAYRHVDSLDVIAGAVCVGVDGKFGHEVENETYAALADFIDRPTCHDVGDGLTFRCSKCGCEFDMFDRDGEPTTWIGDVPRLPNYCPNCGAEVIND